MATIFSTILRKIHNHLNPNMLEKDEAKYYVRDLLTRETPCMVARFGSVEIQGVVNGISPFPFNLILKKRTYKSLIQNAGFFPVSRQSVKKFSKIMLESMIKCDCLGSWRIEEMFFRGELRNAKKIRLNCLSPENGEIWLSTLEGKKVLVIHPMSELIEQQYNTVGGERIWPDTNILPRFKSLITIKSVNSINGNCDFDTWFDALDYMKRQIDKTDFDVALLGCGAYGFPLAAYIKSIGKKAVHIGGALQLLFGIKGKRWEGASFINDFWISPRPQDRPTGFEKVEGGCYW